MARALLKLPLGALSVCHSVQRARPRVVGCNAVRAMTYLSLLVWLAGGTACALPPTTPTPVLCYYDSRVACDYLATVHSALHAPYRLSLQRLPMLRRELRVLVAFEIEQDGSLTHSAVVRSSGDDAFDGASLSAVRRAAPYPRPPPSLLNDGRAQLSWLLAADDNGCGMWNARICQFAG